jgi:hypothetical protein
MTGFEELMKKACNRDCSSCAYCDTEECATCDEYKSNYYPEQEFFDMIDG